MNEIAFPIGPPMPAQPAAALLGAGAGKLSGTPAGRSAEKAAKDFESILLYRLLEEMKRTIPDSGLLGTGASKQMQDLFWYHLAQEMADGGGLGLWKGIRDRFVDAAGPRPAAPPESLP